ncbi:MAG: hypothetical protein IPL79_18250 [Myxococcales bacterium]|nr:hypothetical protein [Myxococcales bacterium]
MPTTRGSRRAAAILTLTGLLAWTLACDNATPPPAPPPGPKILTVATGGSHTCALWDDNSVRCWGGNFYGELGLGDHDDRGLDSAQLGDALPAVEVGTGTVVQLALGEAHTCARFKNGDLRCWGDNSFGQIGAPDMAEVGGEPGQMGEALANLELGGKVLSVSAGGYHTCALIEGGTVKCWGSNDYGQLGQEDNTDRGALPGDIENLAAIDVGAESIKQVVTGVDHTCVLTVDGDAKCFGSAFYGNLGTGNTNDRGDEPGEMGEALEAVDLGTKNNVPIRISSIAAASETTCAILEGGLVKCWGDNASGQLGIGSSEPRGARAGEMGNGLPAVDLDGLEVDELALGAEHVCARVSDGSLRCWGSGAYGENGSGAPAALGDDSDELGAALAPVSLGTDLAVVTFATRSNHTCALFSNGGVKCWGANDAGQLGLGDDTTRGDDAGEMGDALPFVRLR